MKKIDIALWVRIYRKYHKTIEHFGNDCKFEGGSILVPTCVHSKNITLTNIENERIDVDIDPNSDIDDNDDYRIEDKKLQLIRKIKWEYNYLFTLNGGATVSSALMVLKNKTKPFSDLDLFFS